MSNIPNMPYNDDLGGTRPGSNVDERKGGGVALRHAEKSRPLSTCEFADRIFAASMQKLRELSPRFLGELEDSPGPGYDSYAQGR